MPVTEANLRAQEFIGQQVIILTSKDPSLKGVSGTIRDETRNTLRVEADGRILTIPKAGTIFNLQLANGKTYQVNGDQVIHRPEDRVKKGLAKW